MKLRKLTALALLLATTFSMSVPAQAAESSKGSLSAEQIAVIESYENNITAKPGDAKMTRAAYTYSNGLYRGSVLLWSQDNFIWTYNTTSKKITGVNAWQDGGFVFPNTIRLGGITLNTSSNTSRTYRAKKTMGAGVVTPWGDVNVYESDVVDYCQVKSNGAFNYW